MPSCVEKGSGPRLTVLRLWAKSNWLLLATVVGVVMGITLGIALRHFEVSGRTLDFVEFPGVLFMRAVYMVIAPLILTSVVSGICGSESKKLGKIGLQIVVYYLLTTTVAATIGFLLGLAMKSVPGMGKNNNRSAIEYSEEDNYVYDASDVMMDITRNLVPDNIIRAMMQTESTEYKSEDSSDNARDSLPSNDTAGSENTGQRSVVYRQSPNFLGIIAFGITFGVALRNVGEEGAAVRRLADGVNAVLMRLVVYVMYYSPIGILFLVAASIARVESVEETWGTLALLSGLLMAGLSIQVTLLLMLFYGTTRNNPFRFLVGLKETLAVAWSTMSSMAALPTTIKCLEQNIGVSQTITRLLLPVGATVNMDAGAMNASLVAVYVAIFYNIPLGVGRVTQILLYASFTSIGSAGIPNGFFAALLITLQGAHLPTDIVGLFLAVEWITCECGNCSPMPTVFECVCCRELPEVAKAVDEGAFGCITAHPDFEAVCLNTAVLDVAHSAYVNQYGSQDTEEHKDRFKTAVHVFGDCVGASIVDHLQKSKEENPEQDLESCDTNQLHEETARTTAPA